MRDVNKLTLWIERPGGGKVLATVAATSFVIDGNVYRYDDAMVNGGNVESFDSAGFGAAYAVCDDGAGYGVVINSVCASVTRYVNGKAVANRVYSY